MKLDVLYGQKETSSSPKFVMVTRESGIPLLGHIAFGILDRGSNLLQVRATTLCNMNCSFCSTDGGPYSKWHKTNYLVDVDYLADEVENIAKIKGDGLIIFLDSVGEPMSYPHFVDLVRKLRKIPEISEIVVITNGTFLTKEKIDQLQEAGLTRINLSLHSLKKDLSKELFGSKSYDIGTIKESISYIIQKGLDLMITPVLIPGVNDQDIEEIIAFAKEHRCTIGLQKYEVYTHSRKMKEVKSQTYWKFYQRVKELEKKYTMPLVMRAPDVHVEKRQRISDVFSLRENVFVDIVCFGWMPGQMIGKAKNRCISINNCQKQIGDRVKVKILQNKNNIYLAE